MVQMEIPLLLKREILKIISDEGNGFSVGNQKDLNFAVEDSFSHDGLSGADIYRIIVSETKAHRSFIVKSWKSTKKLAQMLQVEKPLESILLKKRFFQYVNQIKGLCVPIIGAVQIEDTYWTIMEDVSEELSTWKSSTFRFDDLASQRELLDRIALFHASNELNMQSKILLDYKRILLPLEVRLRWFEPLFRDWFGTCAPTKSETPTIAETHARISGAIRKVYSVFLDRLPWNTRTRWKNHMQNRDGLVAEAHKLPMTILQGDLIWRNIGLRREKPENTFVLIDWEFATLGHHAFDVYYFIAEPFRPINIWEELLEYYFTRYRFYGGNILNHQQWDQGIELAIAHFGLTWMPFFAEKVIEGNDNTAKKTVEKIIERTDQALHIIPL